MMDQSLSARLDRAGVSSSGSGAWVCPLDTDGVRQVFQALDFLSGCGYGSWVLEHEILPCWDALIREDEEGEYVPEVHVSKDFGFPDGSYGSLVCCTWEKTLNEPEDRRASPCTGMLRKLFVDPFLRIAGAGDSRKYRSRIRQVWDDYCRGGGEEDSHEIK